MKFCQSQQTGNITVDNTARSKIHNRLMTTIYNVPQVYQHEKYTNLYTNMDK